MCQTTAFYRKDEPDKTRCVATSISGGLATAAFVSGIPKDRITMRPIDRAAFERLAKALTQ